MRQSVEGVRRVASALLHVAGGCAVKLRVPAPASVSDDGEQLGLATPEFQELELRPAAVVRSGSKVKVLVSAEAVERVAGAEGAAAVEELLRSACGVVVDGAVYPIEASVTMRSGGGVCCYALTLGLNAG